MFYFLRRGGIFANVRLFFFFKWIFYYKRPNSPARVCNIHKGNPPFCHRFHPVAADPTEITGLALGLPPSGHLWHCNHKFYNRNCGSESSNKKEGGEMESFRGGEAPGFQYSKHDRVRNERRRFLKVRCLIREPRRLRARHQTLGMKKERKKSQSRLRAVIGCLSNGGLRNV